MCCAGVNHAALSDLFSHSFNLAELRADGSFHLVRSPIRITCAIALQMNYRQTLNEDAEITIGRFNVTYQRGSEAIWFFTKIQSCRHKANKWHVIHVNVITIICDDIVLLRENVIYVSRRNWISASRASPAVAVPRYSPWFSGFPFNAWFHQITRILLYGGAHFSNGPTCYYSQNKRNLLESSKLRSSF